MGSISQDAKYVNTVNYTLQIHSKFITVIMSINDVLNYLQKDNLQKFDFLAEVQRFHVENVFI